jgi:hypothetical protein
MLAIVALAAVPYQYSQNTCHQSPIDLLHERNLFGIRLGLCTRVVDGARMLIWTKLTLVFQVRHNRGLLVRRLDYGLAF